MESKQSRSSDWGVPISAAQPGLKERPVVVGENLMTAWIYALLHTYKLSLPTLRLVDTVPDCNWASAAKTMIDRSCARPPAFPGPALIPAKPSSLTSSHPALVWLTRRSESRDQRKRNDEEVLSDLPLLPSPLPSRDKITMRLVPCSSRAARVVDPARGF